MLVRRTAVALSAAVVCALAPALPAAAARTTCFGLAPTITGTDGNDRLMGTPNDDVIIAGSGDDNIETGAGNDRICAGGGRDNVDAGTGHDRVFGGLSNDVLRGNLGRDFLNGDDQDDILYGDDGNDRLVLGRVGRSDEFAHGGLGNDVIVSDSDSFAFLYGDEGSDRLSSTGFDFLDGGPGDDRIEGGIASFETSASPVTVETEAGSAAGDGSDELVGVRGVSGSPHGDTITGSARDEWISGSDGADTLYGAAGNDNVFGGKGEDVVWGNRGHDVLWDVVMCVDRPCEGDEAADEFDGGPGLDRLSYEGYHASVVVDLAAGTGAAADTVVEVEDLFGTSFDDVLLGDEGQNTINGGYSGSDRLEGRGSDDVLLAYDDGDDTLDGGTGTDVCDGGEVEISCEE